MSRAKLSMEVHKQHMQQRRREVQAARNAMNREMSAARKQAGLTYHAARDSEAERGWREQLPLMPPDTRNLTARICGDPLPGRSALDMRAR